MKKKLNKKLRFWAGFEDGKLSETLEYYGDRPKILAIYPSRATVQKIYQDVRLIEIKIISQ